MKKLVIFPLVALVAITFACKDNSFLSTPESDLSAPGLAAGDELKGTIRVTIREEGKPVRTKVLKPQRWDGHSPLKYGTYYIFFSLDEAKSAFADRPHMLERINEVELFKETGDFGILKRKVAGSVNLASGSWDADAWTEWKGGEGPGYMEAYAITNSPSDQDSLRIHEFIVWDNIGGPTKINWEADTLSSSAAAQLDWDFNEDIADGYRCRDVLDWLTDANVWYKQYSYYILKAYDSCGSYCNEDEHYPCD